MKFLKTLPLVLFVFFTTQVSSNVELDLRNNQITDVAIMFSDILNVPIVVETGLDTTVTVYHKSLKEENAEKFFINLLLQNGLLFKKSHGVIFVNSGSFQAAAPQGLTANDLDIITKTYPLNPLAVDKAKSLIQDNLDSTLKTVNLADSFNFKPTVSVLPSENGVSVTAFDYQHTLLNAQINDFDIRGDLIRVNAIVYESSMGDSSSIGLNLALKGTDFSFSAKYGNTSDSGLTVDLGASGNILTSFFSLLESDANTRILTKPSISLMNGEKGYLTSGQNVPIITSTTTDDGETTNTITRVDVGVSLAVEAHIMADGRIKLVVDQTNSSISSSESTASDIITNQRQITSTLLLESGELTAMGGLISEESFESSSGIPFARSLPIVGSAFDSTKTNNRQSILNVLILAEIL